MELLVQIQQTTGITILLCLLFIYMTDTKTTPVYLQAPTLVLLIVSFILIIVTTYARIWI